MNFKDLSYRKPKGTVKKSGKKSGSKSSGKDIQGQDVRVPENAGQG